MKLRILQQENPRRTEVRDSKSVWLATLPNGACTARLTGPSRTFAESSAAFSVMHATWVRTLPAPFDGQLDETWLTCALEANQEEIPDVLAIAMQYVKGASKIFEGDLQIGGDAGYGPMKHGKREEGSDFNDYLGIEWTYPDKLDKPEKRQK